MRVERVLVLAAGVLWAGSLAAPAVGISGGPTLSGYDMLVQGMAGWREGVVAWYANPVLAVALALSWLGRHRSALAAALLGTGLALSSFWAQAAAESAGRSVPPFSFEAGFHAWLAAFAAAVVAALAGLYKESKLRPRGGGPSAGR